MKIHWSFPGHLSKAPEVPVEILLWGPEQSLCFSETRAMHEVSTTKEIGFPEAICGLREMI